MSSTIKYICYIFIKVIIYIYMRFGLFDDWPQTNNSVNPIKALIIKSFIIKSIILDNLILYHTQHKFCVFLENVWQSLF